MAFAIEPPNHADESALIVGSDSAKAKAVSQELDNILNSRFFQHAGRSRQFLQYIVQHGLTGHPERLKERTIGTEVFGRPPGYATGDDPVVRVQAGEVRRRLEQYYQETANGKAVRIELPVGSYVPRFHWTAEETHAVAPVLILQSPRPDPKTRRIPTWAIATSLVAVAVVAVVISVGLRRSAQPQSTLDQFWEPVFATQQPVLICLAKGVTYRPSPELYERYAQRHPGAFQTEVERSSQPLPLDGNEKLTWNQMIYYEGYGVAIGDVSAAVQLSALFGKLGKPDQLRIGSSYSFEDLRNSPAVVVGAYNNKWTMDMTSNLHFVFAGNSGSFMIHEQVPNGRSWMPESNQAGARDLDYGIVARLMDSKTGQFTVITAGVEDRGTQAAGEFVSNREDMEKGLRAAPKDWQKRNMELVLKTRITDQVAGPPEVVAAYYW